MKFRRRNHGLFSTVRLSGTDRRPSRASRPTLGMERCEERTLLSIALISSNVAGPGSTTSESDFVSTSLDGEDSTYYGPTQSDPSRLSADGTKLVFVSDATVAANLVSGRNQASEIFVRDSTTGKTSLVSVTSDGQPGNGDSFDPVISPNGRYVAFLSVATNLTASSQTAVGGVTLAPNPPAVAAIYVRDLTTQATTLLDQTPTGQVSDGLSSGLLVFSPDSTTLAWLDTSDNLTTATVDPLSRPTEFGELPTYVYTRDLATQTTSLVSVSPGGQATGSSFLAASTDLLFSPDSRSLVFGSTATDLTTNLPDNSQNFAPSLEGNSENLFLRNLAAGTTTLLSVTASGGLAVNGYSSGAIFSPDGKSVAFTSNVTDLTANGADFTSAPALYANPGVLPSNIFIRDLTTATTTLVTATPNGLQSNGLALSPVFSPDSSELAFTSTATDLTNNPLDPTLPPGGLMVPLTSDLGANVNNVFLRDLATGTTKLVSVTPDGMLSSGLATQILFSPDGHLLAYSTDGGDLTTNSFEATPPSVPGSSSNAANDFPGSIGNVFISNLETGKTTLASPTTNGQLSNASAGGLIFSPDSGSLFYTSTAIDLTSNPPDTSAAGPFSQGANGTNLFAYDLSAGTTSLISATTGGQLSDSSSIDAFLSPDAQTLYFDSNAPNLTTGDPNPNQSTEIFAASAPFTVANQFQFQSWESSATESDGSVVVTVLRTGPATSAASVNYAVQNGTARAGTDFKATSGTLNFVAGQTAKTFTVSLLPADRFSGTRTAELVLSNPQGANLGYPSAALDLTSQPAPVSPPVTTATPTATRTATPTSTSVVVISPGPTVTSVAPAKGHGGITKLVITFNQALDPASAVNVANYGVAIPGRTKHTHGKDRTAVASQRSIGIRGAVYDAAQHQVTLTLHTKLQQRQAIQLEIKGTTGGVADTQGISLNSPDKLKPGKNYLAVLNLITRR